MMKYDEKNENQSGYHQFLHFCHFGMPYYSFDVCYNITIMVKITPTPAPLGMLEFSKFLIWTMDYVKTNGNKPGYHEFLHFWHNDTPDNQSVSSIVHRDSESSAISLHRL